MENKKRDIIRRACVVFFTFGLISALIIIIVLSKYIFDVGVVCPLYELFGWNCPGCGGTRMAVSLLKFEFYQALRYNAYVFITLPILAYVFLRQTYVYIRYNKLINWIDKFLVWYAVGLVSFGILRNTSIFRWLAPTTV